jgi:hypothetical protein
MKNTGPGAAEARIGIRTSHWRQWTQTMHARPHSYEVETREEGGATIGAVPTARTAAGTASGAPSSSAGSTGRGGSGGVAGGVTLQRGVFDGARSRTMPSSS